MSIRFDYNKAVKYLKSDGFYIQKNAYPSIRIRRARKFWSSYFILNNTKRKSVLWNPYFGMPNFIGFTSNYFNYMWRAYDFLWNNPIDNCTRELLNELETVRKKLNFRLNGKNIEIPYYYSASHYPPGKGFMIPHSDGVSSKEFLLHALIPLTYFNKDYFNGGQFLINKDGDRINTDKLMQCGDIIIYDGRMIHGVELIGKSRIQSIGRIQIFSIPNFFQLPEENEEFLRNLPLQNLIMPKLRKVKNLIYPLIGRGHITRD
jgi:hypothetical protein